MTPYILASKSPRRKALLPLIDRPFDIVEPAVDEQIDENLPSEEAAIDLARQKARSVALDHPDRLVLACDTVVTLDGLHLGKPTDEEDARKMLKLLSGNKHRVVTGCVFLRSGHEVAFHGEADVYFHELTEEEIDSYIATGEPFGKAGGYAVQGHASRHVKRIEGDYYTIMGLPVAKVYRHLKAYEQGNLFSGCNLR